jgi:diguanylate cyclase (GGDEF)-like protein/putative nucleotidyltransferase with HDIG domain
MDTFTIKDRAQEQIMFTTNQAEKNILLPPQSHPMDSSRLFLSLMDLCRLGDAARQEDNPDSLDGLISKTILKNLMAALHYRDVKTISHTRRVSQYAIFAAKQLGWEERSLKMLEISALLHDIGKIGIPDNILHKPGKFSADEVELMSLHNKMAMDVLQACRVHNNIISIVNQAHELRNGISDGNENYGNQYHQGARLLAVIDAYDSLTNDQVYRDAQKHKEAIETLHKSPSAHFDSSIIEYMDRHALNLKAKLPAVDQQENYAPLNPKDQFSANLVCNIFSYLYHVESLYDGFCLLDSDLKFVIWNDGVSNLFNFHPEKIVGHVWNSKILPYSDQYANPLDDEKCPLKCVLSSQRPIVQEMKLKSQEGDWVDVELQTIPLFGHDKKICGVAQIFRDRSRNRRSNQYRQLKLQASRDALTNVANRGELENQLAILINNFQRDSNKATFSLIFLDIDHFKNINDTYGHGVGDTVLIELANLLKKETYSGEIVGRYGGEEFVVLCPQTELSQATKRAERLREAIVEAKTPGVPQLKITSSFGVSAAEPGDSISSLVRRADKALYESKETGRNKVTVLTNTDLLRTSIEERHSHEEKNPLIFERQFVAAVPEDMIVCKLSGFVDESGAKIKTVQQNYALLHVGETTLFGGWGNQAKRQPVSITIKYSPTQSNTYQSKIKFNITIEPRVKKVRTTAEFQERAKAICKTLKSFFAIVSSEQT